MERDIWKQKHTEASQPWTMEAEVRHNYKPQKAKTTSNLQKLPRGSKEELQRSCDLADILVLDL